MRMQHRGRDTKRCYCRLTCCNLGNLPTKARTEPDIPPMINGDHMRCGVSRASETILLDGSFWQGTCCRRCEAANFRDVILREPHRSIWCQCDTIRIGFRRWDSRFNSRMQLRIELTNGPISKIGKPQLAVLIKDQIVGHCSCKRFRYRVLCPCISPWYQFADSSVRWVGEPEIACLIESNEHRIVD